MAAASAKVSDLSSEYRHLVQVWLDEFQRSWHAKLLPDRVQRLPADSPVRLPALVELVKADLACQWAAGALVWLEDYLRAYPELGTSETVGVDLIQAEYDARRGAGDPVTVEAFAPRFPRQIAELRQRIEPGATVITGPEPVRPFQPTETPGGPTQPEAPSPSSRQDLSGQFGRYHIERKLGHGGMGTVYLAHDTQLDRPIALKVPYFRAEDSPELRERFYRDARAAATLSHPNICAVHEFGEIGGIPYLTMTYIEGKPLATIIEGGKSLPQRTAAVVVRKLALALHEAHGRGVIHRDLKPSNIMINAWREPVIMDFGLARRLKSDAPLTRPGAIMGTPAYMPPEVAQRADAPPGPAGDIYSLGVIFYELLTGQLPFQGPVAAMILQIISQTPPPPSARRLDIDPRLEGICLKAMARQPQDRYRTMGEFAAPLTAYLRATLQSGPARPGAAPVPEADDLVVLTPIDPAQQSGVGGPGEVQSAVVLLGAESEPSAIRPAAVVPRATPLQSGHPPAVPVAKWVPPRPLPPSPPRKPGIIGRGFKLFGPVAFLIVVAAAAGWAVYYFRFSAGVYLKEAQRLAARGDYAEAIVQYGEAVRRDNLLRDGFQGRAEARFKCGEYAEAVEDCTRVIQLDRTAARAFAFRGGAYHCLGDDGRAIEDCDEALRLDPDLALAYAFRGDLHGKRADHVRALENLNQAIRLNGQEALAYAYRAEVHGHLGRLDEALEDCKTALNLDPHLALAYAYRGVLLTRKGRSSEALQDLGQAVRLAPAEADVYNARGVAACLRGECDQALADFDRAIHLAPGFAEFYANRADARLERNEIDLALADATEALERCRESAFGHLMHGKVRHAQQQDAEAVADFNEALRLNPGYADAYRLRGRTFRAQRRTRQALGDLNRAIELDPRSDEAYAERGLAYWQLLEDYGQAMHDLDRAVELNPHSCRHFTLRARVRNAHGDYERAKQDALQALDLNPPTDDMRFDTRLEYGCACLGLKQYDVAIGAFDKALVSKRDPLAFFNRGQAYLSLARYSPAIADFEEAIRLDSANAVYYHRLSVAYEKSGDHTKARAHYDRAVQLLPRLKDEYRRP